MIRHNLHDKSDIKNAKSELSYWIVNKDTREILGVYSNQGLAELGLYYLDLVGYDCEILVKKLDIEEYKYSQQF